MLCSLTRVYLQKVKPLCGGPFKQNTWSRLMNRKLKVSKSAVLIWMLSGSSDEDCCCWRTSQDVVIVGVFCFNPVNLYTIWGLLDSNYIKFVKLCNIFTLFLSMGHFAGCTLTSPVINLPSSDAEFFDNSALSEL